MIRRLNYFLFGVAAFLAAGLALALSARADDTVAFLRLRATTVMVNGAQCSGSGAVVRAGSGRSVILTNSHVCNCARYKGQIYATYEGGRMIHGAVIKQSWKDDLCAAEVTGDHPALYVGPRLLPLTSVHTRGYPMGRLAESSGHVVGGARWGVALGIEEIGECPKGSQVLRGSNGNVEGCGLEFTSTLSDLYARPGSSGSPVVNDDGELVGVVSSWHQERDKYDAGIVSFTAVRDFLGAL